MCKSKLILKNILIVFLLLIISVCFCACGQVNFSIISNADGSVEESVNIDLDVEKVVNAGYLNIKQLKDEISADSKKIALQMKKNLNNKIQFQLLQTTDEKTIKILNSYYDGIDAYENKWKDNQYTIRVVFKNVDVYKYYYDISDDSKVEMKEEKHFFYTKMYWYGNTMFLKHRELYTTLKSEYEKLYPNLINHTDATLTYTYCADLRRQHSDADYIEKIDGKYYHTWIVDKNEVEKPIMFYYNVANTYNWILVALVITFVVTGILWTIVLINKNKKKKQNNIENN